jgi:hypothetical protein
MCLDYDGVTSGGTIAVVQSYCDLTPSFLWADWDTSCEDAIVPPSVKGTTEADLYVTSSLGDI